MRISRLLLSSLVSLLLFVGSGSIIVHAQEEPLNLTSSPIFFDFTALPGDTIKDHIRLYNNNTTPATFSVEVRKLGSDDTGNVVIKDDTTDPTISWIHVDQQIIVAPPREWKTIDFTVRIPKDAAFGYYWAIAFKQDASKLKTTGQSKISGASAVPILLTVKKEGARAEGKIVSFQPTHFINEYLPVDFTAKVQNTGNIHIKPHGNIFIRNMRDKDVASLDINFNKGNIIPGTIRSFDASWDDGFIVHEPVLEEGQPKIDAHGKPVTKLVIHWDKLTHLRIGPYTANLLMVFDNGQRDVVLESTTTFWVFPYTIVGAILIVILAILFFFRFLIRWYVRKEIRKSR